MLVKGFVDQAELENSLAQLPPFYALKRAEARPADGRVCPVVKVTAP